ncbi:glycosyltransferase [Roseivirga sp. E12]|uniref:glycosyltransferase n=1 Tax=Roseivirga sp. E12 TaxID=2819237 RepID=UPI001ABD1927|nr:glycosyltransferase [Roseivirga sp. E12]MBO3697022.1 glycosyltransferase [Roseivirga sp. E12]
MKKTKVVIASLLKPIDDTRMLEKFGLSLAETNEYDINIIGFDSKNVKSTQQVFFHPLEQFERLSFARLTRPWKVYQTYLKVKPKVIIFNTHELLIVTCLYKILFGCKIVYDIRENYAKNIRSTQVFPRLIRPFLATWVRFKEWCSKPLIEHYVLAERIYEKQLPFLSAQKTIIENKYAPHIDEHTAYRDPDPNFIDLTYTGTIGASNGIFEAIDITKKLHKIDPRIRLRIVGYCALKRDLIRLKEEIKDYNFIELNGGDHLVPHSEIIEAIQKADFGFVLKKPSNGMNDEKLLTRLFEYTANKLPILLLSNPTWVEFCNQFNAAIVITPENFEPKRILETMANGQFYNQGDTSSSLWKSEEPKLIKLIDSLG